mgnify:FL=1
MMMFKRASKSNADFIREELERQALKEDTINLYPDKDVDLNHDFDVYDTYYTKKDKAVVDKDILNNFSEQVRTDLLTKCLYDGMLKKVLKEQYANKHEKALAKNLVKNFIKEHGTINLINSFKNKSIYLNEWYEDIVAYHDAIMEQATAVAVSVGIPEKNIFEIEDKTIKDFIIDTKDTIPHDITKIITNRVEDAVSDFVDSNKKQKEELRKVYEKAKQKLDTIDDMDNIINSNDPLMQDFNGDPNTELDPKYNVQQEAVRMIRSKQRSFREQAKNVFSIMTDNTLEVIHRNQIIKEAYTTGLNNRIDFQKLVNDTKVMYSFMECVNTLGIVDIDENEIASILNKMKNSIREDNSVTGSASSAPTAAPKSSGTMSVNTPSSTSAPAISTTSGTHTTPPTSPSSTPSNSTTPVNNSTPGMM